MIIYTITNTTNGKIYVGQTSRDFDVRTKEHERELMRGSHCNSYLQNAYNAGQRFVYEAVASARHIEELNELENIYIETLQTRDKSIGYNLKEGGVKGRASEESKGKMSASRRGRKFTSEHRRRISESHKGKVFSEETKRKMSVSGKAKIVSQTTKDKLSKRMKGVPKSAEHRQKIGTSIVGREVSKETRERLSSHFTGKLWWNDGIESIQSYDQPGDGWVRGKLGSKAKCVWWSNAIEERFVPFRPGSDWKRRRLPKNCVTTP